MASFVITLEFDYEVNTSLQVGDNVYHTTTSTSSTFDVVNNTNSLQHIGVVYNILSPFIIEVISEYADANGDPFPGVIPNNGSYITFSKNRIVNNSDLLGYYSSVKFENNSPIKAELFSIGTIVTESSK
tara:strand:+ start:590 stop:976 length:387 start_codon:yes stop_codon:yes gene_type:complete